MNCERYRNLIEKYIEGTIKAELLAELESHAEICESCQKELSCCVLMQDVIKESLSSRTSAEQAGEMISAEIAGESGGRPVDYVFGQPIFSRARRAAVAAGIVLGVGLFLGFALGRAGTGKRIKPPVTAEVPITISNLEGIVLVRHEGSDLWHGLKPESKVYLGDTFHSTTESACVLELDPNSTLELDQNSMLVLKSYNGKTEFNLECGELTADLESPHGPFFISTPHGRVEALGTEFTVKVTDE